MKVFKEKNEISAFLEARRKKGLSVGLVPTMGALHAGHLSLVEKATAENQLVVVTIFVNPTQFDNKTDLEKYPRTLERDLEVLQKTNPNLIVFAPTAQEMYGGNVVSGSFNFDGLEHEMEGKYRKGHFNGVGTVVKLIFEIIRPEKAYFGEKDYQQLLIIKKLTEKHKIPVKIVGCPIKREENGLAMSSRNERLNKETRQKAGFIYNTLLKARHQFGTKSANTVRDWVKKQFSKQKEFTLEYFEIADANTLKTVKRKNKNKQYRAFIAVFANEVRLIDNIALN